MINQLFCVLPLLLLLGGCTHWISEQSRELADRNISFNVLSEKPGAFSGKIVLLGGTIAAVQRDSEGTQLEVTQHTVDCRELPDETSPSGGRFLAITPLHLNPDKYEPGTLISLVGEVIGQKIQPLQGRNYIYPVISIKEIHDIVIEQETEWGYYGGM